MSDPTVIRNDELDRFESTLNGHTAFLTFHRNGKRLTLIHSEVPSSLEGHGMAGLLTETALEYARANDLTVVPMCPFVRSFLEKHPDEVARTKIDMPAE
jgi:predicted GNAT family acetyltransferase